MATEPKLTDKQTAFINEYLISWNASDAAIKAGYKFRQSGAENLSNPVIVSEINRRKEEMNMSADEALARMSELARTDMGDFLQVLPNGMAMLDLEKAQALGKLHLLKKFKITKGGVEWELYDRQRANETIMRHHGLLKDGLTININIELVVNAWNELQAAGIDPAKTFEELINLAHARKANSESSS